MLKAGRRPELVPDNEVWEDHIIELAPDGRGGATVVWEWRLFDHIVQDYDEDAENFGDPAAHPELFDVNFTPLNPRGGSRKDSDKNPRGTKDFTHANAISYNPVTDQVMLSYNFVSTMLIIDHSTTAEEAKGSSGGRWGKGGDILYRFGNPSAYRIPDFDGQQLYNQHNTHFMPSWPATPAPEADGSWHMLCFNNGREPDRHWSSIDEWKLPAIVEATPDTDTGPPALPEPSTLVWSFGPKAEHFGRFFSTHISGCQRLPNGNTLITQGPEGM